MNARLTYRVVRFYIARDLGVPEGLTLEQAIERYGDALGVVREETVAEGLTLDETREHYREPWSPVDEAIDGHWRYERRAEHRDAHEQWSNRATWAVAQWLEGYGYPANWVRTVARKHHRDYNVFAAYLAEHVPKYAHNPEALASDHGLRNSLAHTTELSLTPAEYRDVVWAELAVHWIEDSVPTSFDHS